MLEATDDSGKEDGHLGIISSASPVVQEPEKTDQNGPSVSKCANFSENEIHITN